MIIWLSGLTILVGLLWISENPICKIFGHDWIPGNTKYLQTRTLALVTGGICANPILRIAKVCDNTVHASALEHCLQIKYCMTKL